MTHTLRLAVASALAVLLGAGLAPAPAGADTVSHDAVTWLASQQEADGGFELADFPPFETPDAILAIAEDAQSSATWSTAEALAAVQAVEQDGLSPLRWADDYVAGENPLSAGKAAKFIVLVAGPLGLPPDAFDPAADGDPVDLVAAMDAGENPTSHSYGDGELNATLYALLAHAVIGRDAPDDTVAYLRGAQQANGGWSYTGLASGSDLDVDSTARAVQALAASGVPAGDGTMAAALTFLADQHQATGAWQFFGVDDTNSTAMATIALAAAGWRTSGPCWRTSSTSAPAGGPYVNPTAWLRTQQITDPGPDEGRFASPNDAWGVNTLATTQSVQALRRGWLPIAPAPRTRSESFSDVPPCAPYTQAVAWMAAAGVNGATTGAFGPRRGVTNARFARLVWNTMDRPTGYPDHGFVDVPVSAGYNNALDWLVGEGIVSDRSGRYLPQGAVTRSRAVSWLWRMAGSPSALDLTVSDVPETARYADAVDWAVDNGLARLSPSGAFGPATAVTRAQLAVMLHRLASTEPAWGAVTVPSTVEF